jgi:predicted RNA-binding protein with PUA-like domain
MPNAWIFSSNPEKYDLLTDIEVGEVKAGARDAWQANQRRRDMHSGDIVYQWVTGAQAGIYAVSHIVSEPYEAEFPNWPSHRWWVDLRYEQVLRHPLLKGDLEAHPVLRTLTILRMPRLTNYLLTPEQAEALQRLVRRNTSMRVNETLLQDWIARFRAAWERDEREKPKGYTLLIHADEHRCRSERAQQLLTMEHIPNLSLEELRDMFGDTDALGFWQDRDRRLDEILADHRVEGIRAALSDLVTAAG